MSVSDDSPPNPKPDWNALRLEYETTRISHRNLAKLRNVPYSTLAQRAMREKWSQRARIVRQVATQLESDLPNQLRAVAEEQMAPWIEEKRREFTKQGFLVANTGIKRVQKLFKSQSSPDSKSESFIAKAFETYHRAGRTALGMSDGSSPGGSVNLQILTGQAAVQVNTQP